ncbi:hypothetical protein EDD22DRAFT_855345, partial [Suillus occidentalis]
KNPYILDEAQEEEEGKEEERRKRREKREEEKKRRRRRNRRRRQKTETIEKKKKKKKKKKKEDERKKKKKKKKKTGVVLRLAATYDDMATRFERNATTLSHGHQVLIEDRMYLLHVQRTSTEYVAAHLRKQNYCYRVSLGQGQFTMKNAKLSNVHEPSFPDTALGEDHQGQSYLVPRNSLTRCLGELEHWQSDLASRMARWGRASDIVSNGEVVGWSYKGESYYKGLVLKIFHRDCVELVASPHVNDIQLHMESGWDIPFLKATVVAFSMQFLRVGDSARVIKGSLRGELGTVISTDHTCDSVGLEFNFDGYLEEAEVSLRDIERVFRVGDTVRVVAGPYMGLEGHLIQMSDDVFHICQETTKEVVEVSKYYLDRRPLRHTLKAYLPTQQHFEPPSGCDSIEIGDYIQVLDGEHTGRRGVVSWFSKGDTNLWFRDIFTASNTEPSLIDLATISVPVTMVQRTDLAQTIVFTTERGYDVRPGDTVSVTRRPEFGAQGLVQHVDFPNARLSLVCDGDKSLLDVPIRFTTKIHNASLDSFKKDIGHEVFVIGGEWKGYRGTLDSLSVETCTVALCGQVRTTLKLHDVVTRYGMRLNGVMLQGLELVSFCDMRKRSYLAPPPRSVTPPVEHILISSSVSTTDSSLLPSNGWTAWSSSVGAEHDLPSSINPSSSSALQPWSVDVLDIRDSIEARAEKLRETGLDGVHEWQITETVCVNGMSRSLLRAGAAVEHYHIPASDLSPAPPRKKNQECLILDGIHRGLIRTVSRTILGVVQTTISIKCRNPDITTNPPPNAATQMVNRLMKDTRATLSPSSGPS